MRFLSPFHDIVFDFNNIRERFVPLRFVTPPTAFRV